MKRFLTTLFAAVLSLTFIASVANASPEKGQKLVVKHLKGPCGFTGAVLAAKHTQAEWKKINDEGKLGETIKELCPKSEPLKDKYLSHIYDFLYNFASDSGNVPS